MHALAIIRNADKLSHDKLSHFIDSLSPFSSLYIFNLKTHPPTSSRIEQLQSSELIRKRLLTLKYKRVNRRVWDILQDISLFTFGCILPFALLSSPYFNDIGAAFRPFYLGMMSYYGKCHNTVLKYRRAIWNSGTLLLSKIRHTIRIFFSHRYW